MKGLILIERRLFEAFWELLFCLWPEITNNVFWGCSFSHILFHTTSYECSKCLWNIDTTELLFNALLHQSIVLKALYLLSIRQIAKDQLIGHNPQGPNVTFEWKSISFKWFRGHVVGRASIVGEFLDAVDYWNCETKICELDMAIFDE